MPINDARKICAGYKKKKRRKRLVDGTCVSPFLLSCSGRYPFSVFSDCEILFAKFGCTIDPVCLQNLHVLIHLLVRHLCVKLCGGNRHVSHHTADRFYRNAERERDVGSEIMPGLMETEKRYEQWKREESVT